MFTIYPICWIARYSVYDYDGVNAIYTGLANFKRILTNEQGIEKYSKCRYNFIRQAAA